MKKLANHIFLTILSAILCVAASSCGTKKSATSGPEYPSDTVPAGWTDLHMPVTFEVKSPKQMSFSGRMTLVRDADINFSLRFIGMEVAVLDVTPETLTAVDKYHRMALREAIGPLLFKAGLTFADIQDLLLGRASAKVMSRLESSPLSVSYGPMQSTEAGELPRHIAISATVASTPVEIMIIYKPEKAKWNSGRTVNVTIPESYRMIDARALVRTIKADYPL